MRRDEVVENVRSVDGRLELSSRCDDYRGGKPNIEIFVKVMHFSDA